MPPRGTKLNRAIAVCGTIALVILAAACGSGTVVPEPTPTPTPVPFDPKAVLERSGKVMQDLQSFHFKLTHDEGGTEFMPGMIVEEATGDVVKPDKIALSFAGTFGGGYAIKARLITIGDVSYMTNPLTGVWQEFDTGVSPLGFFDPAVGISAIMLRLDDAQRVEADREDVFRMTGILPADALAPLLGRTLQDALVDVDLTIDAASLYLLEARVSGRVTESDPEGIVRILEARDFDQPLVIEPPE